MTRIALLFLIIFFSCRLSAQPYSIYQNITTSNGLPSNYVFAVCEDEKGFLWIGTDKGLSRFDGFRWKTWDKDNGLPGNYVNRVIPDKRGGLWLDISDKGFFHFDSKGLAIGLRIPGNYPISKFDLDSNGDLYAESSKSTPGFVEGYLFHASDPKNPERIYKATENLSIRYIIKPGQHRIFCFTSKPLDKIKIQKSLQSKWPVTSITLSDDQLKTKSILHASDSLIITNTDFIQISPDGSVVGKVAYNTPKDFGPADYATDGVFISTNLFIKFSKNGKVLYSHPIFEPGTNYAKNYKTKDGFYVYDIKTGYYFISNNGEKKFYNKSSGLGTDYVNEIYQTKDGTIIICTLGAGLQLIKNNYRKTFVTDNKLVRTILPVNDDWYVLAGDKISKIITSSQSLKVLGNAGSSTFTVFKTGDTLLVGSLKGITFYKERSESIQPFKFIELNAGVSSIARNGNEFLGGSYGNGLIRFDKTPDLKKNLIPMNIIEKLVSLKGGFAALSYEDGVILRGTNKTQDIHLTSKDGLLSSSVYSLHAYNDTLWIGTKGGLNVYSNGRVINTFQFTGSNKDENVLFSFHDARKKLWAITNKYLYDLSGNTLKPIASHPLISDDDIITTAAYNESTDELAIGSNKAFTLIDVAAIQPDLLASAPQLMEVILDGSSKKNSSLKVPFKFNKLDFVIAPSLASTLSKSHYYYQLKGRDDSWNEVRDSLTISFSALRPGKYDLIAKTVNADGYESKQVKMSSFIVERPFWQQWPFLLLALLATIFTTAVVVKQVDAAKRRKKEMKRVLQESLQNERERISKDLHDHLGANLATIIAQTDNIEARLYKGDVDSASATVQNLSSQTREAMNVLRETIWAVQESEHSLEEFIIRIRTFLQRLFESTSINWHVTSSADIGVLLSPTQTLHLFRIIQEASHNIVKHSKAKEANYHFSLLPGGLQIIISDDGLGINTDKANNTNGLINMRERAKTLLGTFAIHGTQGTVIKIIVPL